MFKKCNYESRFFKIDMATKNIIKGDSFAYAYKRINVAIDQAFYLEAVTLCESIISDRLYSFVSYSERLSKINLKEHMKTNKTTNLSTLINKAKKFNKLIVTTKTGEDLFESLNKWRLSRNKCVHSVAKSEPGYPTIPVEVFIETAKATATEGKYLARMVCDWHTKTKGII